MNIITMYRNKDSQEINFQTMFLLNLIEYCLKKAKIGKTNDITELAFL